MDEALPDHLTWLDESDERLYQQVIEMRARQQADALNAGRVERFRTGVGQNIVVHARNAGCDEQCVIHNPSDHVMKDFPTNWRADRGLMERMCPHGVGHPDPDDLAFKLKVDPEATHWGVHGCDGCCTHGKPLAEWSREQLLESGWPEDRLDEVLKSEQGPTAEAMEEDYTV
jgi:hypothetical protein